MKYDWLVCKINHQRFTLSLCRFDSCPWTCSEMRFHASVSEEVMKRWLFLWSHMLLLPNSCAVSDLLIRLSRACRLGLEWFNYLNTSWKGQSPAFPVNNFWFLSLIDFCRLGHANRTLKTLFCTISSLFRGVTVFDCVYFLNWSLFNRFCSPKWVGLEMESGP